MVGTKSNFDTERSTTHDIFIRGKWSSMYGKFKGCRHLMSQKHLRASNREDRNSPKIAFDVSNYRKKEFIFSFFVCLAATKIIIYSFILICF